MTDSEGNIIWRGRYSTWGRLLYEHTTSYSPQGFRQPLRMQGQYDDGNTGLYYNTFRYYDADAGRFNAKDPIGLNGGDNLYQYAENPIMRVDPLGLYDITINDTGGRNGPTYGGTMTVTGQNGQSVTVPVSTWPNPTNASPGIQPGAFESTYSPTGHQGTRNGVRVNNGGYVPTNGPNPAQRGQPHANGINIHCGNSPTNRGSAGYITIDPARCQDVWNVLQANETETVRVNR